MLLSVKFYALQKVNDEKNALQNTKKQYETQEFLSLLDSVKKYNENFRTINDFYKGRIYLSDILEYAIGIEKPEGIKFESISLIYADNKIKGTIQGESAKRNDLISFKNNLLYQKKIQNLYLPPGDLLKPSDIDFSMNFEIKNGY